MILPHLTALHLGAMHPFEQVLTLLLAFGPFVVLGAVIVHRRRHDASQIRQETHLEDQRDR